MTFDEIMKQALNETIDERLNQMLAITPKPKFSLSYRIWEYKTLKDFRKNQCDNGWTLRKARRVVTTVMLATTIVLALTACTVVGITTGRFSFDNKHDYSELFTASLSSDKTCIEEYYGLPKEDGWEILELNKTIVSTLINYKKGEKKVYFGQRLIHGYIGNVNTENAKIEPLSLYEENDGFFIEYQSGECGIYWIFDGYLFDLGGNITKNEAINLALSTKIVVF